MKKSSDVVGGASSVQSGLHKQSFSTFPLLAPESSLDMPNVTTSSVLPESGMRNSEPADASGQRGAENPVRNAILNCGRLLIVFAGGAVTSVIIARSLGAEAMGLYTYALWVSNILVAFCHFGIPTALIKFVAEYSEKGPSLRAARVVRKLLVLQAAAIVLVVAVGGIAVFYFSSLKITLLVLVLVMVLPQAFQQALISILVGTQKYAELAWVGMATSVLQILAVAIAAVMYPTVGGFLAAVISASTLSAALITWFVRRATDADDELEDGIAAPNDLPVALKFAAPVWYLVLLDMVVWQRSEIFFLKRSSRLEEIAFYSVAFLLATKLADVVSSVTATLLPMQSQAYARGGVAAVAVIQNKALRSVQTVLVPLGLFAAILAKPIISAMYGTAFREVTSVLWILLVCPVALSVMDVGIATVYAVGKQNRILAPLTFVAILNIVLAATLVPRLGAVGAAVANASAQVVEGLIVLLYATSILASAVPWRNLLVIYSAAMAVAMPAFVLSALGAGLVVTSVACAIGCAAYVMWLTRVGEIAADDWSMVKGAVGRRLGVGSA